MGYWNDEVSGEEDVLMGDDEALLGASRNQLARRPYRKPPLSYRQNRDAKMRSYMGMGFASFVGTDGSDKVLIIEPQEAFRGERLIVDVIDSAPPAGITVIRRIDVGSMPQSPSVEAAMPASAFFRDATYTGLDLQVAQPGVKISIVLGRTSAPGGVIVTTVAAGFYGEWIR